MNWFGGEFRRALGMLFILWLLWYISGGPARIEESKRPFLKPPSPLNTGEVFGDIPVIKSRPLDLKKDIRLGGTVDFYKVNLSVPKDDTSGYKTIEIANAIDSRKNLNISGWTVQGIMDKEPRKIGNGVQVFYQGRLNPEREIVLYPGDKAIISAGESPVGVSFKTNKCSGYLQQFQIFEPKLSVSCPHPVLDQELSVEDQICDRFIRSISRCSAFINEFPSNISSACKDLVNANFTHNSCVQKHSNDRDFYTGEWRVYLGGEDTFGSKNGDFVTIYDENGNKIDSIFFN